MHCFSLAAKVIKQRKSFQNCHVCSFLFKPTLKKKYDFGLNQRGKLLSEALKELYDPSSDPLTSRNRPPERKSFPLLHVLMRLSRSLTMDRYWVSFTMAMMALPPIRVQVGQKREWKTAARS